jgi:very-short-patch-repair endonuclease
VGGSRIVVFVKDGYERGSSASRTNPPEVDAIVDQIAKCLADPAYDGLTFGVVSLLGTGQAKAVEKLLERVSPEEWTARDLRCGDAADFQGVIPQFPALGYSIDLVVVGAKTRLAAECDGDRWHGPEAYQRDMGRQRELERCGWHFVRVQESDFYLDPAKALAPVWERLDELEIHPSGWSLEVLPQPDDEDDQVDNGVTDPSARSLSLPWTSSPTRDGAPGTPLRLRRTSLSQVSVTHLRPCPSGRSSASRPRRTGWHPTRPTKAPRPLSPQRPAARSSTRWWRSWPWRARSSATACTASISRRPPDSASASRRPRC